MERKKEGMEHKILARIQNVCYNGYAREPFGLKTEVGFNVRISH